MNPRVLVETQDEKTRIKTMQNEIKEFKELLIKKGLDRLVLTPAWRSLRKIGLQ
jgi:hypothetical protein